MPSASLSAVESFKELNTRQVMEYIGATSTQTVWAYVKAGKLPKPRYIRPHSPLWRLGEVLDHTHKLMQDYDEGPRGLVGRVGETRASEKPSSAAEKVRERLFGKK